MGSIVDEAKVRTNEIISDYYAKDTSEVVFDDHHEKETSEIVSEKVEQESVTVSEDKTNDKRNLTVVFVLGGPGAGKSTQCANLAKQIGYTHLSIGDLFRKAMKCDPEYGPMIESVKEDGKSVPPDVTMRILLEAIDESGNYKFLLDGFPRDEETRAAFEAATQIEPELVLFFDCSEEEREKRILNRNQGRVDDNPDSVKKRFKKFQQLNLPVVEYYCSKGKVLEIDAAKPMAEVFKKLKSVFNPYIFTNTN